MTGSSASWALALAVASGAALVAGIANAAGSSVPPVQVAQANSQSQAPAPLPSQQIGPAPQAKPPETSAEPPPQEPRRFGEPPKTLELRIDPNTGKPLTAEELQRRQQGQAPQDQSQGRPQGATPGGAEPQRLTPRRLFVPRQRPAKPEKQAEPVQTPRGERDPDGIEIKRLARPDPGSIGVLEPADGGLGHDMWSGSERGLVLRLMPALPVRSESQVVQQLRRRLLLSTAVAPAGLGESAALLRQRIELLWASGRIGDTAALLRVVPPAANEPAFDRARLDVLLTAGRPDDACTLARNMLEREANQALQKVVAFCLARDGRSAEVELYEQLLFADGVDDPVFFELLGRSLGRKAAEPEPALIPTPLQLAMVSATEWTPSSQMLDEGTPLAIWSLARSDRALPPLKVEAAERAALLGIIDIDELRDVYKTVALTQSQIADPVAFAEADPTALPMASLYRAIEQSQNTEALLNFVEAAWRHAQVRGREAVVARAMRPLVEQVQPTDTLSVYASITIRVLLTAGALETARSWYGAMIDPARLGDPHAAAAVLELAPLIYAADLGEQVPSPGQVLSIWWQNRDELRPGGASSHDGFVLGVLETLGRPVADVLWRDAIMIPVVTEGRALSPATARQLGGAAAQGRLGETVLLVLMTMGEDGPAATAEGTVLHAIAALKAAGLVREAHLLAVEGLLARGF